MSLATLLNKITTRHRERVQTRLSDYRELVRTIADGKEPDDEQIAALLHDTDKSIEQFKHDVELYERRRQMQAKMRTADAMVAEKPALEKQIEEHDQILVAAQAKRDADVTPLNTRLYEIKQAVRAGEEAKQELIDTCEDEPLLIELKSIVEQHQVASHQRCELVRERDQQSRWAEGNLHEATVNPWPQMQRKYHEDAEYQQAKAKQLTQQLTELEPKIRALEKREAELREQLLEP